VDVNGLDLEDARIFRYRYSGGVGRGHTVIFDHRLLMAGRDNDIYFARRTDDESGSARDGLLHVSQVVLWYQRWVNV
jgi:hypothetical protein